MAKKKLSITQRIGRFKNNLKTATLLRIKKLARFVLVVIAVVVIIPLGLTLLYIPSVVHPVSTLMLGRLVTFQTMQRDWVAFDDINPVLVHSVMMSEDARFCAHSGIDWAALNQVIDSAIEGEKTRGASTLSMQTVKNLFLWPGRSYFRKVLEFPLALFADWVWSKQRMVEIYLNIAEWDEGVFGIEAAARHYFKKSAASLSARQSGLLAVTLPNPKRRNPAKASKTLKKMGKRIERRAYQSGAYVKCVR